LQKNGLAYREELDLLDKYIQHCIIWAKEAKLKDLYLRRLSLAEENEDIE
jgi:hypothetical protein